MEIKYYLPKIKELHIYNYDLYKCPLDILFSSKLNLVFGTNGLGKTTLLNILQYSIIGPYTGKVKSRNWKDQQKLKRPMLDKNYFKNRMSNQSQQAEVKVVYSLGKDSYEVWHCFIVDAGMQYLFVDGKVDESINSCFQKTKTMQEKLDVLKPISRIKEVFAHFIIECVYKKDYYDICFDDLSGKVKAEIKERDLRNILLQYLAKNMRGEVSVEFCTDYLNDEESVDIYIYDGSQRAIIEVKFSLPKKYYAGSTHYSITTRTGDGIKQLDKYARHLAKDGRLVDFGYVYMFYMSDMKEETLKSHINRKINEILRELSDELNTIFDGVEINDMKCWGTAS